MTTLHIVITGGASGLGLGCARRFSALGHDVTICDINPAAGQQALDTLKRDYPQRQIRSEVVDLSRPLSIDDMAQRLQEQARAIDVLINNAGIYPPSNLTLTDERQELTFAIAHLGHFRLTHALWPLLAAAPQARIVSISSMVQKQARLDPQCLDFSTGYMPILAYQQAKLSCLLFALELQRRLEGAGITSIRSYAAHPGVARTQLGRNREQQNNAQNVWQRFTAWLLANGLSRFGQTPEQAADSVLVAALSNDYPAGSYIGPKGFMEMAGKPGLSKPGKAASDPELAAQLWERTEAITGLRFAFGRDN